MVVWQGDAIEFHVQRERAFVICCLPLLQSAIIKYNLFQVYLMNFLYFQQNVFVIAPV